MCLELFSWLREEAPGFSVYGFLIAVRISSRVTLQANENGGINLKKILRHG